MKVDLGNIGDMVSTLREGLEDAHSKQTLELWGNLRANSPVDHGRLAGSWTHRNQGYLVSTVGTSVAYAMIQNDGVDPFVIEPVNGQALYWAGAPHPVKKVNHPGFSGSGYIDESIDQANSRADEFVRQSLRGVGLM